MRPHDFTPEDTLITDYCDSDTSWGPLLFLRPARSEPLGSWRCFVLAVLPGSALGLFGSLVYRFLAALLGRPALPVFVFPILLTAFYFLTCRFLLAPPWNRRANLLTRGRS
jgi:hypothetical protein